MDSTHSEKTLLPIILNGTKITVEDIINVSRFEKVVHLTNEPRFLSRIERSCDFITSAVANKETMYGINTNFGGLAHEILPTDVVEELQENLIWGLKCNIGEPISDSDIRAAMLLRAHALSKGISAVRTLIIQRYIKFINLGITPVVKNLGSIGASGDLVPLAQIAGAIIGLDANYKVRYKDELIDCISLLRKINEEPIKLRAKEGLGLINSTAMMTGIAAGCIYDAKKYFNLTLWIHSFFAQSLQCSIEPFDEFVHAVKPHKGQIHVAELMRHLLQGSKCIKSSLDQSKQKKHSLVQDRYSLRCIPQFLGPIADGLKIIQEQIEVEANSIDDNPLVDIENERIIHSGNFMGQYVAIGMDQLKYYFALLAKHLDAQIALVVSPEFNQGLPGSLFGNAEEKVRFGLKGLQICANSIMPRILHLSSAIAPLFPTHAEQYNQNINSQGFNSAILARDVLHLYKYLLSLSCIFAVQSISLRCKVELNHFDGRQVLSEKLITMYECIHDLLNCPISKEKPIIFRNNEQALDDYITLLFNDISSNNSHILEKVI